MKNQSKKFLVKTLLSILCGGLAGVSAAVLLIALQWVTQVRQDHQWIVWALPFAGLLIGWIYHRMGQDIVAGTNLIIDEIHDPQKVVPFHMAPFILVGTLITHLFGGSAGREGTAVQMGASLSDQLAHYLKLNSEERRNLLMAGIGAGFGSAVGAPFAGVIFGMEVIRVGRIRFFAWYECLVASVVAYYVALFLKAPHSIYPAIEIPGFALQNIFYAGLAGLVFGLAARFFTRSTHLFENVLNKWIVYAPMRPFVGGLLVLILFYFEGSFQYAGLGIESIQNALTQPSSFQDPLFKSIFTTLTVGSGFKGGEFVPLVFIGSTLGSALSLILPLSFGLLAVLGFAAVFGAAANTPIACAIMAVEIFGWRVGPYVFVACLVAYIFSDRVGIYRTQRDSLPVGGITPR